MLWRIFSTEQQCAAWCRQQFAQMAREHATVNAGVLFDYTNGKRPSEPKHVARRPDHRSTLPTVGQEHSKLIDGVITPPEPPEHTPEDDTP
jgi:hypothetical protein